MDTGIPRVNLAMAGASRTLRLAVALIAIAVVVLPLVAPLAESSARRIQPVLPLGPEAPGKQLLPQLQRHTSPALQALAATTPSTGGDTVPPAVVKVLSPDIDAGSVVKSLEAEAGGLIHVTLITGDEVYAAKTPNGTWAILVRPVKADRTFRVSIVGDNVYVIPSDVNLEKFSIDLFNVKLLAEYQKLGIKDIPIIVKVRRLPGETLGQTFSRLLPAAAGLPHKLLHIIDAVALRVPPAKAATVYRELALSPVVEKVTLDHVRFAGSVRAYELVKPALYRSVPFIGVPSLWRLGINGSGMIIAILDTGIDASHPDLYIGNQSKVIAARSFVDLNFDGEPDEPPEDGHGHGTHCAGIAAGAGNYMPEIRGVAPGALLLNGKVLSNMGWGYDSWIIQGIEWAVNNSADIISMSLGGLAWHGYDPLVDAVNKAFEKGVVVVVAAGNEGPGLFTVASPGVAPGALTVGAYDVDYQTIAWFSSRGPTVNLTVKPDVVAPGVDILSARASGTYMGEPGTLYHIYASGTSMATPHVAGFAALVKQLLNMTGILQAASQALGVPASHIVKGVIISTATGYDEASPLVYGMGIINATNLLYLLNNSLLVIPEPAHTDIVVYENGVYNVTVRLFNPFNTTRVLRVEPILLVFPGAAEAGASNAVTVPSTVEVPAGGTANLTVSIDASKLPVGVHALRLLLVDNETGVVAGKAMIGVGKPALVVVHAYYNGKPVVACANVLGLSLSGGWVGSTNVYGGYYGSSTCANGTLVVGPLLPNTAYLVTVEMQSDGVAGGYYFPVIVSSTETGVVVADVSVDFAELPKTTITVPPGDYLIAAVASHSITLTVTVGSEKYSLGYSTIAYTFNVATATLEYHVDFGSPVSSGSATAEVSPGVFDVESYLVPLSGMPSRVYIFHREYSSIPYGETVVAKPSVLSDTILHVHSTVGSLAEGYAGLAVFCGSQSVTVAPGMPIVTGSLTAYMIDSNTSCDAVAFDDVEMGDLSIYAYSWWEYSYNGYRAYAPLAFPARMTTLWNYMFAWEGLDGYNFSGAWFGGNIFRTWLTGSLILSSMTEPLMAILVAPNHKDGMVYYYPASISGVDLYWIADNTTPPSLYVEIAGNSGFLGGYGYAFGNETVDFRVSTIANGSYVPGVTVYEFGYGVGGRDIVPLAGYDPLLNAVPPGENLVVLILFNEPVWAPVYLNTSSVQIQLVAGEVAINGTVLQWGRLSTIPLPYAIVAFPTANAPAGAYALHVTAEYYDNGTGSRTYVSYTVKPAVYIGEPAGQLSYPYLYNVTIAARLTDLQGNPLTELKPGTIAVVDASYSLVGFTGTAKLVVELVKDGETVMKAEIPVKPGTVGSHRALVAVPWAEGTYKVRVYLLLDNTIAVLQMLPTP
jgi:subtilisin family serine protease